MIEAPTTVRDSLARVVRFAQELIAQRCNSWVARRAAVPCKEPMEIFHVGPLLTVERNQALMATTELGHMPMHLPEEAEEGDERTKAAIKRDQEQQEKEKKQQQKDRESSARFNMRDWDHGHFHALQSRRLSRGQLQAKVQGVLTAYGLRKESAELRNKVEVSAGHAARCKREHHMLRLLAPSSAGRFHSSFLMHSFLPSFVHPFITGMKSICEDTSNRPAQLQQVFQPSNHDVYDASAVICQ